MKELSYKREILSTLRTLFGTLIGEYIFPVGDKFTMVANLEHDTLKVYNKATEELTDFTGEGIEHGIFDWIMDNQYNIPNTLQSKIIDEVLIDEPENFVGEVMKVYGLDPETRKMDMVIGTIGVVRELTPENHILRKCIFISPDATWTTLTAWYEGTQESEDMARADVGLIADALNKFQFPK